MARETSGAQREVAAAARPAQLLDEGELIDVERRFAEGISSRDLVDVFITRGVRFSEATLRKYVQLGLLPRSVRVGRKGKHQGSLGLYPVNVVRRVNLVKKMMAEDRTIEDIQRSMLRFKDDIDTIEKGLRDLMAGFEREMRDTREGVRREGAIEDEIGAAKKVAGELIRRIGELEKRLSARDATASGPAVRGGERIF